MRKRRNWEDSEDEEPAQSNQMELDSSDDSSEDDVQFVAARNRDDDEEEVSQMGLGASFGNDEKMPSFDGERTTQMGTQMGLAATQMGLGMNQMGLGMNQMGLGMRTNRMGTGMKEQAIDKDFAKFELYSKGIGSKLMQKMGYKMGTGLGKDGRGISVPIDVKLRPKKMGLGHEGFEEKVLPTTSTSSETKVKEKVQGWKKNKFKTNVSKQARWKTAQEIIDEQVLPTTAVPIASKIIDMTGKESKILDHIGQSTMSIQEGRLPELKYNVKLLGDLAKTNLEQIARQIRLEELKIEKNTKLLEFTRESAAAEAGQQVQVQTLLALVLDTQKTASALSSFDITNILRELTPLMDRFMPMLDLFRVMKLDRLLVACLVPHFKTAMRDWNPLEDPEWNVDSFLKWKSLLQGLEPASKDKVMTPFDAMLYSHWLPKIRSCITNEWDPKHPDVLVSIMENWKVSVSSYRGLIPLWMSHNIAQQLILPRLTKEIQTLKTSQRSMGMVHLWLFPWLPILGDFLLPLWTDVRRKAEIVYREFDPLDRSCLDMCLVWKDVLSKEDLDTFLNVTILPSLIVFLRSKFRVNPANQDLAPLNVLFPWSQVLSDTLFSQLLQSEFFPVWEKVLWVWVTSETANLDEISRWYTSWQSLFRPFSELDSVKAGFRHGLDMMNQGLSLRSSKSFNAPPPIKSKTTTTQVSSKVIEKLSFMEYFETLASECNVELVPLNRIHTDTGKPLYKLGKVVVYFDREIVHLQRKVKGDFEFVSVDEALELAK